MLDSLEDQPIPAYYTSKAIFGQLFLLTDMCLLASATLDAHLNYMNTRKTSCRQDIDQFTTITWTTVGYSLRILFTSLFFLSKVINLYKFLSKKHSFPRIGAFYSPLMSTLLLSIIVYDFQTCQQLSEIFSISSAEGLVSWYSILVIVFVGGLLVIYIICYITKRSQKNKLICLLKIVLGLIVVVGCLVGIIANVEMMAKRRLHFFSAFDLYSFFISVVAGGVALFNRYKKHCVQEASPVSSL
jgi:hypothetical protein